MLMDSFLPFFGEGVGGEVYKAKIEDKVKNKVGLETGNKVRKKNVILVLTRGKCCEYKKESFQML
jgi:hypothetical protein